MFSFYMLYFLNFLQGYCSVQASFLARNKQPHSCLKKNSICHTDIQKATMEISQKTNNGNHNCTEPTVWSWRVGGLGVDSALGTSWRRVREGTPPKPAICIAQLCPRDLSTLTISQDHSFFVYILNSKFLSF